MIPKSSMAELPSPAGNPFLEPLDSLLSTDNLERRLECWPLKNFNHSSFNLQARHDLLERLQDQLFIPTLSSIDTTTRLYRLIRRGYMSRNPTQATYRAQAMSIAQLAGNKISDLPWNFSSAKGMRISAITGLGKTYEVLRALTLLDQKIQHGTCQSAGWTHMTQATWLYVAMSHDGSLGGLLLQVLTCLDCAIGTAYAGQRSLTGLSNEKLAVHVGIILNNHGVGVLVIDELQSRNFSGGARGGLAATFFLRLLNFGVPIVLMGNPFGFEALDSFSQDVRRIGSGGSVEMHPLEKNEFDFKERIAPALWKYNVMPEPSPINDSDGSLLFKYCGGIREFASRIRVCSQRLALDLGDRFVTEDHMEAAFMGPDFDANERTLIAGFREKDPLLLQNFEDIPWKAYAKKWNRFTAATTLTAITVLGEEKIEHPRKPAAVVARINSDRRRTKKLNADARNEATKERLLPDDMRDEGLKKHLIQAFVNLKEDVDPTVAPAK